MEQNSLKRVSVRLVRDKPLLAEETIDSPEKAIILLGSYLSEYDREVLCVVNLDGRNRPINMNLVSVGSVNESIAHPREIIKSAVLSNASGMIMLHNHPSGILYPSQSDTMITDRMIKVGELVGISLIDSVIVGGDNLQFFSFREKGMMDVSRIKFETDYHYLNFDNEKYFSKDLVPIENDTFFEELNIDGMEI